MLVRTLFVLSLFVSLTYSDEKIHKENIHHITDSLILTKSFSQAEIIALEAHKRFPDEAEVTCALACVYRNKAQKPVVNINLGALGIKEDETNVTVTLDSVKFAEAFDEQMSFDRDEYKKAEELYKAIIFQFPQYQNAYYNLLNDYVTLKEFDHYFEIISLFIKNITDTTTAKNALLDLGFKLAKNPDIEIEHGIKLYKTILKRFPACTYAKSDLGAMFLRQGKTEKAIPLFKSVYETDPKDDINTANYLSSLIEIEDLENALPISKELGQSNSKWLFLYGLISYSLNKPYQEIFHSYAEQRKQHVKDTSSDFWCSNARTFEKIHLKNKEDKIGYFEYLLDNFNKAKMYPEAIVSGIITLKLEQTNYALIVLGSIFDRKLNLSQTLKYLHRIEEKRKSDSTIISEQNLFFNYGRIYLATEHFAEAERYFKMRETRGDCSAKLNHYLGLCAMNLGRTDEAILYFKKNAQLDDNKEMEFINKSILMLRKLSDDKK